MNIDRLQNAATPSAQVTRTRPRQLDVTLSEPAIPASLSKSEDGAAPPAGSIKGVLSAEEEQAIASIFTAPSQGYNRSGNTEGPSSVPGLRLNIQV